MNPERLLQHFERISEAPDAILRLRRFILDLAVRGKLVEQDPNDEPAVELLASIASKRAHLLAQGYPNQSEASAQLRKQSKQQVPQRLTLLPQGWTWATLLQCSLFVVDCHNKTAPYAATGTPLIRTSNVRDGQLLRHDLKFVNDSTYVRWSGRCPPEPGDILITREAPMGEVCVIPEGMKVCLGQRMMLVRLGPGGIDSRFLLYSLRDPFLMERVQDKPVGATVEHLRVGGVETLLIPLPPLAEQHRIVAKVDELMALCDQLEAAKTEREQSRDRLVAASLHRLNSPADTAETDAPDLPARQADAFRDHARFVFHHLPRFTTRPEHIKQLRQTILNLAVCGRLSPAADWLEQSETLRAVALLQNGYAFKSEWFVPNGIRLLRNANVSHGMLCWDELACLPENRVREFERFLLSEGDVVLSLDRPFIVTGTKVARVRPQDMPCLLLQRVGRFQLNADRLCSAYLFRAATQSGTSGRRSRTLKS